MKKTTMNCSTNDTAATGGQNIQCTKNGAACVEAQALNKTEKGVLDILLDPDLGTWEAQALDAIMALVILGIIPEYMGEKFFMDSEQFSEYMENFPSTRYGREVYRDLPSWKRSRFFNILYHRGLESVVEHFQEARRMEAYAWAKSVLIANGDWYSSLYGISSILNGEEMPEDILPKVEEALDEDCNNEPQSRWTNHGCNIYADALEFQRIFAERYYGNHEVSWIDGLHY